MIGLHNALDAVLYIFSHDEELRMKARPHVDVVHGSVNWDAIYESDYSSGHQAAIAWAYCLWLDQASELDPFAAAFSMDAGLRRTVIRALAMRWSIPIDKMKALRRV